MRIHPPLCIREAVLSAIRRPVRSLLVLQAIVWGSAAAVFPQALLRGTREASFAHAGELAGDRIVVAAPEGPVLPSWDEIDAVPAAIPQIVSITGLAVLRCDRVLLVAADARNLEARRRTLAAGRNFTAAELEENAPVCIVEPNAPRQTRPEAPGEETVAAAGHTFRVIGTLAALPASARFVDTLGLSEDRSFTFLAKMLMAQFGISPPGMEWLHRDEAVLVPWKTLGAAPTWLLLRAEPEDVALVVDRLQQYFATRGATVLCYSNIVVSGILRPELDDIFSVSRDIFLVCLLMGLMVTSTAMLITVNERRREIAVRRCEGATARDIVAQFLLETGVFCLLGSTIGVALGLGLAWWRSQVDPSVLVGCAVPWGHVGFVIACVFAGGLIAGIAPAYRAAKLDPVEVFSRG